MSFLTINHLFQFQVLRQISAIVWLGAVGDQLLDFIILPPRLNPLFPDMLQNVVLSQINRNPQRLVQIWWQMAGCPATTDEPLQHCWINSSLSYRLNDTDPWFPQRGVLIWLETLRSAFWTVYLTKSGYIPKAVILKFFLLLNIFSFCILL